MAVGTDQAVAAQRRSLVLVAGSGRSGTSLFTGILQRLGYYVPQPEVPPDETNPRGFAESQWVVDFHTQLLKGAGVQVSDARPAAWALMADAALDDGVERELRAWLGKQLARGDHVIIKDPRLSWFLPLWRRCSEALGLSPRFVTVLRHPAAVIDSKQRSYGTWQGDVGRAAAWLNQSLYTERATRGAPRAFVRYNDLLEDWTRTVGRVGDILDLRIIRDAPAPSIVRVHEFVDRSLSRSRATWEDFDVPAALREQGDAVWGLLSRLAEDDGAASQALIDSFESARAAYVDLYEDAEAIAQSSIEAVRRSPRSSGGPLLTALRIAQPMVPVRYRRKVPLHWRKAIYRALSRGDRGRR